MSIEGFILLVLLAMFEKGALRAWWAPARGVTSPPRMLSADVAQEKNYVDKVYQGHNLAKPALLVLDLQKKVDRVTVLQGLTFHVDPGECFVVMGLRGCGKATMLEILSGVQPPSGGTAKIGNVPLEDTEAWQQKIGFCPRYDGVLGRLTLRQTLNLYASIRGIESKNVSRLTNHLIELLNMHEVADDHVDVCGCVILPFAQHYNEFLMAFFLM